MKRIWSIEEQTIEDKSTGFKLEFVSSSSPENPLGIIHLKLWNEGRSRVAIFEFNPEGYFMGSNVELTPVAEQP